MFFPLLALLWFFIFLTLHILLFRFKIIRFETSALAILLLVAGAGYAVSVSPAVSFLQRELSNAPSFLFLSLKWSSLVLYLTLCFWYIAVCITFKDQSPSMKIIAAMLDHPEQRLTYDDLKRLFTDEEFIVSRLGDLVTHGHLGKDGDSYYLLPRGKLIAFFVRNYRALLKQELGG